MDFEGENGTWDGGDDDKWIVIPAIAKCPPANRPLPVPPVSASRSGMPSHFLQLGGLPVPAPKARFWQTASARHAVPQLCPTVPSPDSSRTTAPPSGEPLAAPSSKRCRTVASASDVLRLSAPSKSTWLIQQWMVILGQVSSCSQLASDLFQSDHGKAHASRILDQFAPSTLLRYFSAWQSFFSTLSSLHVALSTLSEVQLSDILLTCRLSRGSDKSSCCGCALIIKAVRWVATNADVACLKIAWSPVISSFLRSRVPKELKEAIPFPLFLMVHFERRILMSTCPLVEVILLGSILAATWGGLRFADAQRCSFDTFVFDGISFRANCWRTKTSHRGQPWGFQASGFLSLGPHCWTWKWLQALDQLWHQARSTDLDMAVPDFLFPRMDSKGIQLPWRAMSYADMLYHLRRVSLLPWRSSQVNFPNLTAHSMKTTLLTWGAQLAATGTVTTEERHIQGHHKQGNKSMRLYSRDDVFAQLQFQTKLINAVHRGVRFQVPQHRGAQKPMTEPAVQMEFYRKDLPDHSWFMFNFEDDHIPVPSPPQHAASDDEASSGSSSSSSSDSEHSGVAADATAVTAPDELLLGFVSHIQHAMVASTTDIHPFFRGQHFAAACGTPLHCHCKFAEQPDPALMLCQRPACKRAWQALLLK